jgi:L-2,4-diaminobutyric acid acetyltransferase
VKEPVVLRIPLPEDGMDVYKLVKSCPPLDTNSVYCNLLQCSHFAGTSVAADSNGELVGFISGYLVPGRPETLFVWQVAVAEQARGQGLASRMLQHILERSDCDAVTHIETTITEENRASWALFEGLANKLGTELTSSVMFDQEMHFDGQHDSEMLVRIGPF